MSNEKKLQFNDNECEEVSKGPLNQEIYSRRQDAQAAYKMACDSPNGDRLYWHQMAIKEYEQYLKLQPDNRTAYENTIKSYNYLILNTDEIDSKHYKQKKIDFERWHKEQNAKLPDTNFLASCASALSGVVSSLNPFS